MIWFDVKEQAFVIRVSERGAGVLESFESADAGIYRWNEVEQSIRQSGTRMCDTQLFSLLFPKGPVPRSFN